MNEEAARGNETRVPLESPQKGQATFLSQKQSPVVYALRARRSQNTHRLALLH